MMMDGWMDGWKEDGGNKNNVLEHTGEMMMIMMMMDGWKVVIITMCSNIRERF